MSCRRIFGVKTQKSILDRCRCDEYNKSIAYEYGGHQFRGDIHRKGLYLIMAHDILMTQEGYEALKKELEVLKTVKRSDISEKIKIARGFGDLSENSEYDEAKNEQAIVEARINQLEDQILNVKIVDQSSLSTNEISVGCKVEILDIDMDETLSYRIVSSVEGHQSDDAITEESPMGVALMGHKSGDIVDVSAPSGTFQVKVLSIGL